MNHAFRRTLVRRIRRALFVLAAPVLFGVVVVASKLHAIARMAPEPYTGTMPEPPRLRGDRLNAIIVAGNGGTEATDLLAPYQVLAASGAFNVVVAAPERRSSRLFPGGATLPGVDLIPHFDLDGALAAAAGRVDLVVVPFIPTAATPADGDVVAFVRERSAAGSLILSICGGSMIVADAGLLDGLEATSHRNVLRLDRREHPGVAWKDGVRYVDAGPVVTSAGITAGIDATLHVVRRLAGDGAAMRAAQDIGYPHDRFLDDPTYTVPPSAKWPEMVRAAFAPSLERIAVLVEPGISEIGLAAALDTYPRTYSAVVQTVAGSRTPIRTRHGLDLVAWSTSADAAVPDLVIGTIARTPLEWVGRPRVELDGTAFPFDTALRDVAGRFGPTIALSAATGLEYPTDRLDLRTATASAVWTASLGLMAAAAATVFLIGRRAGRTREAAGDAAPVRPAAHRHPTHDVHVRVDPGPSSTAGPAPGSRRIEVDLVAAETAWTIAPGRTVPAFAYNGTVPGPEIHARVGDVLIVRLTNRLAEPTTIHWHGIRVPASMDGTETVQRPVQPGETFEYRFALPDAGTFWYHPHANETVQMERGLYGALIVHDEEDGIHADRERVFVLDDMRLSRNDRFKRFGGFLERHNGREGATALLNGAVDPVVTVSAGQTERWRLINASSARYVRFALPGHEFVVVGTDGGLLEAPLTVDEWLLAPGNRIDMLAGPFEEGDEIAIAALPYDRGLKPSKELRFGRIRVDTAAPTTFMLPDGFRAIEEIAPVEAPATREVVLSGKMSIARGVDFMIHGERHATAAPVRRGSVEVWDVVNSTPIDHPFHLHGFFFQVLAIDGDTPPHAAWLDTVNVPARSRIRIAWQADDRTGSWMYHCHILEHAAAGMMAHFDVI